MRDLVLLGSVRVGEPENIREPSYQLNESQAEAKLVTLKSFKSLKIFGTRSLKLEVEGSSIRTHIVLGSELMTCSFISGP